jgi:hypothetical protein
MGSCGFQHKHRSRHLNLNGCSDVHGLMRRLRGLTRKRSIWPIIGLRTGDSFQSDCVHLGGRVVVEKGSMLLSHAALIAATLLLLSAVSRCRCRDLSFRCMRSEAWTAA